MAQCASEYHYQLYNEGEDWCPLCGDILTEKENKKLKLKSCPNCNAKMPMDRRHCNGCGINFDTGKKPEGKKNGRRIRHRDN